MNARVLSVVAAAALITACQPTTSGGDSAPQANGMTLTVELDPGLTLQEIASPYHDLRVQKNGQRYDVTTVQSVVPMDRDFKLTWRPVTGSEPAAAIFRESIGQDDYLMMMILPPEDTGTSGVLPRDIVFVIDTSGSMPISIFEKLFQCSLFFKMFECFHESS